MCTMQMPFFLTFLHEPNLPYFDMEESKPAYGESWPAEAWLRLKVAYKKAKENMISGNEKMKEYFDRSAKVRKFKVGEEVLVFYPKSAIEVPNPKLAQNWKHGRIADVVDDNTYLVKDIESKTRSSVVHASRLQGVKTAADGKPEPDKPKEARAKEPSGSLRQDKEFSGSITRARAKQISVRVVESVGQAKSADNAEQAQPASDWSNQSSEPIGKKNKRRRKKKKGQGNSKQETPAKDEFLISIGCFSVPQVQIKQESNFEADEAGVFEGFCNLADIFEAVDRQAQQNFDLFENPTPDPRLQVEQVSQNKRRVSDKFDRSLETIHEESELDSTDIKTVTKGKAASTRPKVKKEIKEEPEPAQEGGWFSSLTTSIASVLLPAAGEASESSDSMLSFETSSRESSESSEREEKPRSGRAEREAQVAQMRDALEPASEGSSGYEVRLGQVAQMRDLLSQQQEPATPTTSQGGAGKKEEDFAGFLFERPNTRSQKKPLRSFVDHPERSNKKFSKNG